MAWGSCSEWQPRPRSIQCYGQDLAIATLRHSLKKTTEACWIWVEVVTDIPRSSFTSHWLSESSVRPKTPTWHILRMPKAFVMTSSLLSQTTTQCSNSKHIIFVSRSYGRKFSFPTTYIVVSLLIRLDVNTCFLHLLMILADYRCRSAWMLHRSRQCLNYCQGFLIRRSPYWANRTVREDHHWALSFQQQQKPAESPFDGYLRWEGQSCRLHQQAGGLQCWRDG